MKTIIVKILTAMPELAQEALDLFNGGRPEAEQVENFTVRNNTPVSNGYCRIVVTDQTAQAMEQMLADGYVSPNAEIVRIEHHGQDMVDDGQGGYTEELFQTGEQDITDEQGAVIGTRPAYLGRIKT